MLFSRKKKKKVLLKDPNELGCDNKRDINAWVNLSVINVSVESFLQYPEMNLHRTPWEELSSRY